MCIVQGADRYFGRFMLDNADGRITLDTASVQQTPVDTPLTLHASPPQQERYYQKQRFVQDVTHRYLGQMLYELVMVGEKVLNERFTSQQRGRNVGLARSPFPS